MKDHIRFAVTIVFGVVGFVAVAFAIYALALVLADITW